MAIGPVLLIVLGVIVAIPLGVFLIIYLFVPAMKGVAFLFKHLWRFVSGMVYDLLRFVGAIVTSIVLVPLTILNVLVGRWSASAHYGKAIGGEIRNAFLCLYRVAIGHPFRFLGLGMITEGIEKRLPQVVAFAPTSDLPSKRTGQFDGYKIVGSLASGGSGGKLYIAEPDAIKQAVFARAGRPEVRQVVIKSFSLRDGSSLPQIIRESQSLEAAKRLALVLDHELTKDRFFYVMEYVPGQSLAALTTQMHAASGDSHGLDTSSLRAALGYTSDLLRTLDTYHKGGLWHKDVKPDNIIVDGMRAHLVDFGLVTPLASAMTLTTHGTEYFRDPELVRLALKGVRVHEVDGTRFDIYAAGAVLYSIIENSFPAHGVLSQISRRCPEALRWIVRRAMTDYDKRYRSAGEMLADVDVIRRAPDPFAVRPIDLPSMRAGLEEIEAPAPDAAQVAFARAASPVPPPIPGAAPGAAAIGAGVGGGTPKFRIVNWWSGRYHTDAAPAGTPGAASGGETPQSSFQRDIRDAAEDIERTMRQVGGRFRNAAAPYLGGMATPAAQRRGDRPERAGRTAVEQLKSARARVQARRDAAQARISRRRRERSDYSNKPNAGVVVSTVAFVVTCVGVAGWFMRGENRSAATPVGDFGREFIQSENGVMVAPMTIVYSSESAAPTIEAAVPSREVFEIGAPKPPAPPLAPDQRISGRVLVVVNLNKPLSKEFADSIASITARLAAIGLDVRGDYPGNGATAEQLSAQLDTTARALAAAGSLGAPAPEVFGKVQEWLNTSHEADLVLWIGKSDPDAAQAPKSLADVSVTLIADPSDARLKAASRAIGLGE
jgi:serine/threonine protein kinase